MMRKIIFITSLLLPFACTIKAQTSNPNVYVYAFIVDGPTEGSSINAESGKPLYLSGTLSININAIKSSFNFAMTNLAIMDGATVLASINGPTFSKGSDFYNDSDVSNAKQFNFDVQPDVISQIFSSRPNAKLVVRYKFSSIGSSTMYPLPEENIGEYYTDRTTYGFLRVVPAASFSGPDQLCSEGTYTITNAGTITLENANGIATLEALGNNQWKITRIGNASGRVFLKSSNGGKITYNYIIVGNIFPTSIDGNNILNAGNHTFTLNNPSGNAVVWTVSSGTNRATIANGGNSNIVQVNVSNWNTYGLNQIILEATITSPCGGSTIITRTLGAGSGVPIEET